MLVLWGGIICVPAAIGLGNATIPRSVRDLTIVYAARAGSAPHLQRRIPDVGFGSAARRSQGYFAGGRLDGPGPAQ